MENNKKISKFQPGGSMSDNTWLFTPGEAKAAGIYSGSNDHSFLTPNYPELVEDYDPEVHGYKDNVSPSSTTFSYPDINTSEGRRYATRFAMKTASGEIPYENVPRQYMPFVQGLQNGWKTSKAISDFGYKFAPVLAGSAIAPFAISGIASGIGTGAFGNAGRWLLNKTDDAVAWLSKSGTKFYDPRHIVQTIFNPTKAYTGFGEAAAAGLDMAGAWSSINQLRRTFNDIKRNGFNINHVPEVTLNTMGTLPLFNYGTKFAAPVASGVSRLWDDTVRSYQNLRNGVEPVFGVRSDVLGSPRASDIDIDGDPFGGSYLGASAGHANPNGAYSQPPTHYQQPAPLTPYSQSSQPQIWDDTSSKFKDLLNRVTYSLGVFDDTDFATIRPKVQSILEEGYRAGKSPEELESELDMLWESYNKPMFKKSDITINSRTSASLPMWFSSPRDVIMGYSSRDYVNPVYSRTPLDRTSVRPEIALDDELGYTHWYMVDSTPSDISKLKSEVLANTPHGGSTYEMSKSLQSSPLAHQGYVRMANSNKGLVSYLSDGSGNYEYIDTNNMEGSTWSPRIIGGRLNRPSATELIEKNAHWWEELLNATDQRVFDYFGGAPKKLELNVRYPGYESSIDLPIIKEELRIAPLGYSATSSFVRPQQPFRKPGYYVDTADAVSATSKLDDYVASVNEPRIKVAQNARAHAIADLQNSITLPGGAKIVDINGNVKVSLPDGSIVPLEQYATRPEITPELKPILQNIIDKVTQIQLQYNQSMLGTRVNGVEMKLIQPVAGFRLFKLGGMMPKYLKFFTK